MAIILRSRCISVYICLCGYAGVYGAGACPVLEDITFTYPNNISEIGGVNWQGPKSKERQMLNCDYRRNICALNIFQVNINLTDITSNQALELSKTERHSLLDSKTRAALYAIIGDSSKSQNDKLSAIAILNKNTVQDQKMTFEEAMENLIAKNNGKKTWQINYLTGRKVEQNDVVILSDWDTYRVTFNTELLKLPVIYLVPMHKNWTYSYRCDVNALESPIASIDPDLEIKPIMSKNTIQFSFNRDKIKSNPFAIFINDWMVPVYITNDITEGNFVELDPRHRFELIYRNGLINKESEREIKNFIYSVFDDRGSPIGFKNLPRNIQSLFFEFNAEGKILDIKPINFNPELKSELETIENIKQWLVLNFSVDARELKNYNGKIFKREIPVSTLYTTLNTTARLFEYMIVPNRDLHRYIWRFNSWTNQLDPKFSITPQ